MPLSGLTPSNPAFVKKAYQNLSGKYKETVTDSILNFDQVIGYKSCFRLRQL